MKTLKSFVQLANYGLHVVRATAADAKKKVVKAKEAAAVLAANPEGINQYTKDAARAEASRKEHTNAQDKHEKRQGKQSDRGDHSAAQLHRMAAELHSAAADRYKWAAQHYRAGNKDLGDKASDRGSDIGEEAYAHEKRYSVRASDMEKDSEVVSAAHGEATGKPSMSAIQTRVTDAVKGDARFDSGKRGYQRLNDTDCYCCAPYCCDLLVPDDDGKQEAVVRTDDGRLLRVGFEWDGENLTLTDGEPVETEAMQVYAAAHEAHIETVKATWSDAAREASAASRTGKESRATDASKDAEDKSKVANKKESYAHHHDAAEAHLHAAAMHGAADETPEHDKALKYHLKQEQIHHEKAARSKGENFPTQGSENNAVKDIIHCRDSGTVLVLADSSKWILDEPATFQWMPGGVNTITAHYGDGSIELTVDCDEATAAMVQASYEKWVAKHPKQEPFGCVEHREEEAAVRFPKASARFEWKDDPDPGVYATGTPTELGAKNVNGRVHRSWSPSFTTDAAYAKAKDVGGVLTFPEGVRGSATNPARVTGIGFSVGSLTNKPAFKNISPVRAKEAAPQPQNNTREQNNQQQETEMKKKVWFVKARGAYQPGSNAEFDEKEADAIIKCGDATGDEVSAARIMASDAELTKLKGDRAKQKETTIKAKVAEAKKRGAIPPKDEAEETKVLARLATIGASEEGFTILCEMVDGLMPDIDIGTLATRRHAPLTDAGGNQRVVRGAASLAEESVGFIKAREPMSGLIRAGRVTEALKLSQEASVILKNAFSPIMASGEDVRLSDLIKAADFTDPDSQVGTLATGLVVMRNLGYLKNKLGWMPFISTDMRNEPAKFKQPVLTRYITPPNILTYVPGIGYTSDATTIANNSGETETSGTLTKSAPSTTDVTVTIDQHKAVEIEFHTNKLGSTMRNLFAEQQGAQFYTLAETVNAFFLKTLFSATWSGIVTGMTLGNFALPGMVKVKNRMTLSKLPDTGRFALMHSTYYDGVLNDSNLMNAKAILSLLSKDASSMSNSELPPLFGVQLLETQLASYASGVYTAPTITAATGDISFQGVNQVGFAGNSASGIFVARVPQDYTTVLGSIPATAAIEILTEPDSGLSVMFVKYVNHEKASVSARCALMYGAAQGDPRQGIVLAP